MKFTLLRLIAGLVAVSSAFAANRFETEVTGHGRPVLLLPGLNCSGKVWDDTVAHLAGSYQCHVLTLAGFAGLPPVEGDFLAPTRDAIADYIRIQKLDKPFVIGHSLGGFLAMDLAATHPDLVGPVVVVDAYPFLAAITQPGATLESARASARAMQAQLAQVPDEAYRQGLRGGQFTGSMVSSDKEHERIVEWSLATDRATSAKAMTEMLGSDLRDSLSAVKVPVLVMASWVAYAPYVNHALTETNVRSQYAKVSQLEIAITDTARHFIMQDDPKWFQSEIDTFLAKAH